MGVRLPGSARPLPPRSAPGEAQPRTETGQARGVPQSAQCCMKSSVGCTIFATACDESSFRDKCRPDRVPSARALRAPQSSSESSPRCLTDIFPVTQNFYFIKEHSLLKHKTTCIESPLTGLRKGSASSLILCCPHLCLLLGGLLTPRAPCRFSLNCCCCCFLFHRSHRCPEGQPLPT